ncbi:MAG TPA: endolytic transglycosylase MltG [Candidatus Cybelea sp.]
MKRLLAGLAFCVLVATGVLGAAWYSVYRDRTHPQSQVRVVVERGATFDDISRQLAGDGVIGNVLTFRALAKLRGQDVAVRAGEYRFEPHVTQSEVLRALVTGGAQVASWVTIPEGFTAAQIAGRLATEGLGSEQALRADFMSEQIVVDGSRTKNLEGFLFPSTYLVPLGDAPRHVASLFTTQFYKALPRDAAVRAKALQVTVPQAVTVASLVEREAKNDADRPKIAAVIYNRLRLRMPLQVDATIEYALPAHKSELSFADLRIDSPYNSYVHAGLPPTPIANPGLPSLLAALRPARTEDLYYVYCGNGRHVFAKTLAEHQANVARCLQ